MSKLTSIIKKPSEFKTWEIFESLLRRMRNGKHTLLDDDEDSGRSGKRGYDFIKLLPGCPGYYYFVEKELKVRSGGLAPVHDVSRAVKVDLDTAHDKGRMTEWEALRVDRN